MPLNETAVIREFVKDEMLCGSRVTCNPPVTGTDQDVLVRINRIYLGDVAKALYGDGWNLGGSGQADDDFESWTKGDINLILVWDLDFYARHACATALCRGLNLLAKGDRCVVFRAMLYNESPWLAPDVPASADTEDWSPF
jgi:hypothetical protein